MALPPPAAICSSAQSDVDPRGDSAGSQWVSTQPSHGAKGHEDDLPSDDGPAAAGSPYFVTGALICDTSVTQDVKIDRETVRTGET